MVWIGIFAICLMCMPSYGWFSTGHKVIAFIAWEDLSQKTRSAITAVLKQHPRYEKDLLASASADESTEQQARTVFAAAATWPDVIRSLDHPMHAAYAHPAWHYIDIPFATEGQPANEKPSAGPGPHNLIEALDQCTADLKDGSKSDAEKAVDLCWVEHLIGDVHQPLHTASWFSPKFPEGDQGGNAETVLKTPPYSDSAERLHLVWDGLPGDFASEDFASFEAAGLRADGRYSRASLKDLLAVSDPMAWAKESHQLAVDDAYLDGNLKTATARRGRDSAGGAAPGLPPGYLEKAEHVAMHQLSLAGYRLADVLNGLFDSK